MKKQQKLAARKRLEQPTLSQPLDLIASTSIDLVKQLDEIEKGFVCSVLLTAEVKEDLQDQAVSLVTEEFI